MIEDSEAALWAALLGAIIVPGVALHDSSTEQQRDNDTYIEGYDDGLAIGEPCEVCEQREQHNDEL